MSVDLESLRLIPLIDSGGSLGAAARALGISQPAASARLRSLEARYRLTLVTRSARGSTLTDDGRAVCAWAQAVLAELSHLEAGMDALAAARRGDLKIAASLTIAEHLMPQWLGELQRSQPEVHAGLIVANSAEVLTQVRSGAVSVGFIESPVVNRGVRSQSVGSDRLAVVVAPGHPWASARRPISGSEIAATPLVVREVGSGTRETFERALGSAPLVAMEAGSTAATIGAAVNGVGPAIVSEIAVRHAIADGTLIDVPVALDLRRSLRVIWRGSERLRSPARELVEIAVRSHQGPAGPAFTA